MADNSRERKDHPAESGIFYLDLMSHELLNFNQAVLGYLELIQNDPSISEDMKHYLISAIDQVRNSSQLIDDVKKIANLGLVTESTFELFALDRVVEEAIADLKLLYPDRNLEINFKCDAEKIYVKATDALHDVVLNLLTNAIKFDPAETIVVDVTITHPKSTPGMIDIIVEDRGPGIPDHLKKVLASETILDDKTKRIRGMGLLLVRAATKRFGGKLIIGNRVGNDHTQGAKLTVRLPEVRRP